MTCSGDELLAEATAARSRLGAGSVRRRCAPRW